MIKVKDWESHQHYKDRNPPWIKLQRDLLRDYKFSKLPDESKSHLMLIWLLASQMDNAIPNDAEFIQRQIGSIKPPDIKLLINSGFIYLEQDASNPLASCKQSAIPETETETEAYTEEETDTAKMRKSVYSPQFDQFWSAYPNRTGKAAAFKSYRSAIKTHGVTHEYLLDRARQFAEAHRRAGTPSQYIPHPTTWLNQGRWEDDLGRITARTNGTQPAPNARGSQFSAVLAAAAELMQEGDMDVQGRPPGLSQWGHSSGLEVRPSRGNERTGLPAIAHRDDPAGGQTIDHDATDPADG